ncbi:TetR/AcrR family transcriptional regulator [uncultured Caulobacter sp.]|uniref:TetR/AcrR family transcriptional regulator n=1 Tax=uncultured Caulobacter sp. TaxID=158749 RepID=UPI0026369B8A|nr:TetR/AcrR family transcriptional regulator [uncultured Caulobacter sp.]
MATRNSGEDVHGDSEAGVAAPASKRPARDRIFETARELFYQHGIRAVGVETIAAEADATKMTLYRNFPSKDELVAEVLREQEREYWAWWEGVTACCCGDPRGQLEAIFDAFETKACDSDIHGCPLSNAAIELHEENHPAQVVSVNYKKELHRRLVELCRGAGAKNDDLADALMLMMEGAYISRVTLGAEGPVRAVSRSARALIKLHLDGC